MLVRLLYVSTLKNPNDSTIIESILQQSRLHNPARGITGVLVHSEGIFLQAVEGGRQQVNELYSAISKDTRHSQVVLLHYEEIEQRRYGSWSMGQVNLAKVNASVLLKYSETATLNPYAVSGSVSLALLEELMVTAAVIGRA